MLYTVNTDQRASLKSVSESGDDLAQSRLPIEGLRVWKSRLLSPEINRRFHDKSLQLKVKHSSNFVIDETNDTICGRLGSDVSGDFKTFVPRGFYLTLTSLSEAVKAAVPTDMEAAYTSSRLYWRTITNQPWLIFFDVTASGTTPLFTAEDYKKCARLFAILGVDTNNPSWYSSSPTFLWGDSGTLNTWIPAKYPAEQTRTFRSEWSALKMRVDTFKRAPT